ncbi:hypothetical protein Tco_0803032 [Tanacetum coccineum]|uniref:Uncharacterized protein n=1 Tax=Tanacetum coccineum TaxID=301880 RepID=A0ABQ5A0F6_9ASTR
MAEANLITTTLESQRTQDLFITTTNARIRMGCLPRSACLGSRRLTRPPNLLVHGERLEIRDNLGCAIRKNLDNGEWSRPTGFQFARENLQSRVEEETRSQR